MAMMAAYLWAVCDEAVRRNYRFDRTKIADLEPPSAKIEVSDGQMRYEFAHLLGKLETRDPPRHESIRNIDLPEPHPCMIVVPGPIATWERP